MTETDYGVLGTLTSVSYNYDLLPGLIGGWIVLFYCILFLVISFCNFKIKTVSLNHNDILLYCGFSTVKLYINGEVQDELFGRFNKHYLEGKLKDGTRVTATYSVWGFHLSFSNNIEPIDLL